MSEGDVILVVLVFLGFLLVRRRRRQCPPMARPQSPREGRVRTLTVSLGLFLLKDRMVGTGDEDSLQDWRRATCSLGAARLPG